MRMSPGANTQTDSFSRISSLPSSPKNRAVLEGIPDLSSIRHLEFFDDIQGTRSSSLPPTVVLSPSDTTPPGPGLGTVAIPAYDLTMPFDLKHDLIENDRKVALTSGGTLEDLMLDLYHTNREHSSLKQFIDWGLIDLSDTTITERLRPNTVKELLALTRRALGVDPEWKKVTEKYRDGSSIIKDGVSYRPLEDWYLTTLTTFKDYPASILSYNNLYRHELFYSFLDHLFAMTPRISRRHTLLTQPPSKRDASHCTIHEYFDREYGLQLAYLEHQLHAKQTEFADIFYLSKVLLETYRKWLAWEVCKELAVFAVICSGPRMSIYKFCPVSDHFVVVTAYTGIVTMQSLPKLLEMLYKVKLSMDHSIHIFDQHFTPEDPF